MKPEFITDHIDIWTSAVKAKSAVGRGSSKKIDLYGIKKLRELILELAVRGKLVPQDSNDEPASVLLERIAVEKERLVKCKIITKSKSLPSILTEEIPKELPLGWKMVRLGEIASRMGSGSTPRGGQSAYVEQGVIFLRSQNVWNEGIRLDDVAYISEDVHKKMGNTVVQGGDVLLNITGASLGRTTIFPCVLIEANVNQHVTIIRLIEQKMNKFVHLGLMSPMLQKLVWGRQVGMAIEGLSKKVLEQFEFPIPPLQEQHRIVAKVDELMSLCDKLEQQTQDRIDAHQLLVETLLATLTNNQEGADFAKNWARLHTHFDILFTTERSIDALKQTILQLAVMGKLVPQDPNDEPASKLLERIAKEKAQLIKDKKIKKQKDLPPITEEEKPFDLPKGWEWCHLPDLGNLARGKSKHRPRNDPQLYINGTIPLIQTGDVARANGLIETYTAKYNDAGLAQSHIWKEGTLCITIAANIADTGILSFDACFPDSVVGYTPYDPNIPTVYFDYFIRTAKENLEQFAPSTAQKNINLEILSNVLVPCPPTQEFKRIVTKIEKLFSICNKLKQRLQDSQQTQLLLTDAIVQQAL